MMHALLKRDVLLFVFRGTEGFSIVLLYLMGIFLLNFHGGSPQNTLVHSLFLMFFILSQSLGNVLRDDYRYGFLDMMWVRSKNFEEKRKRKNFFGIRQYAHKAVTPALEQGSRATGTTLKSHSHSRWQDLVCCPGSLLEGRDDSREVEMPYPTPPLPSPEQQCAYAGVTDSFLSFLWIKILVWWGIAGSALSLLSCGFLATQNHQFLYTLSVFMLLSFVIILVTLMISCLVLGARAFKGGVFILAMPIYVPPFLFTLWALDPHCTVSRGQVLLGGIGMILFYTPLCLALSTRALREALEYK